MSRVTKQGNDEIRLTNAEKWLREPKTYWKHLGTNYKLQDYQNFFNRIYDHAGQELKKCLIPQWPQLPTRNAIAWSHQMESQTLDSVPVLKEFLENVYKAQAHLLVFPSVRFLIDCDPLLKMGFSRSDYTREQVAHFIEAETNYTKENSVKNLKVDAGIKKIREDLITGLATACETTQTMVEFALDRNRIQYGEGDGEMEDNENAEKVLGDINYNLRIALTKIVVKLIDARVISRGAQKFIIKLVSEDKFDISLLQPKDLVFLISDCQIIRQRNVKGKSAFQLNDLSI